jgi:glycosyltransferase involved in cell wall biosynthesis
MTALDLKNRTVKPRVFMMDLWATVPYYTAYLSKALLARGVQLTVGSITYYLDPGCYTSRGIQVDPGLMDFVGRFKLPQTPRRLLKLVEAMLNLSALSLRFALSAPDIIHVQYLPMLKWRIPLDLWFLAFCRKRGAKIVLTVHDLLPHDTAERYKQTFYDLYHKVDSIICHSDHISTRLQGEFNVPDSLISVIPHGPFFYDLPASVAVDVLYTGDVKRPEIIILWQGIIFPYKGIDLLLDSWQRVEASGASAQLIIAGTGDPHILESIRTQIARLGLQKVTLQLRFITSEELVALYRAADIVVYPYRAITTSGALATGLALGKTIVASDLPVFRELLIDGENCFLVNPDDSEALASALLKLIERKDLRDQFATRIRDMYFGDASWLSIANKTISTYYNALAPSV